MSGLTSPLDDHDFLDAVFNVVLPESPSGDLPAAGDLGLAPAVAAGLRADPLLGPLVEAGLGNLRNPALADGPPQPDWTSPLASEYFRSRLSEQPFVVMGLLRYLYPAYYGHPRVLAAIGEVTRPPFPEGFEVEPTDPELIRRLESRRQRPPTVSS